MKVLLKFTMTNTKTNDKRVLTFQFERVNIHVTDNHNNDIVGLYKNIKDPYEFLCSVIKLNVDSVGTELKI